MFFCIKNYIGTKGEVGWPQKCLNTWQSWCFSYVCSICACLVLSVSSSSCLLGRAAVCDCDTPWTFLLPLFCKLNVVHRICAFVIHHFIRSLNENSLFQNGTIECRNVDCPPADCPHPVYRDGECCPVCLSK